MYICFYIYIYGWWKVSDHEGPTTRFHPVTLAGFPAGNCVAGTFAFVCFAATLLIWSALGLQWLNIFALCSARNLCFLASPLQVLRSRPRIKTPGWHWTLCMRSSCGFCVVLIIFAQLLFAGFAVFDLTLAERYGDCICEAFLAETKGLKQDSSGSCTNQAVRSYHSTSFCGSFESSAHTIREIVDIFAP